MLGQGVAIRVDSGPITHLPCGGDTGGVEHVFARLEVAPVLVASPAGADIGIRFERRFFLQNTKTVEFQVSGASAARIVSEQVLRPHDRLAREFASTVRAIASSAAVYYRFRHDVLDLWIVLPQRDAIVERALAEAACELMVQYPDALFDFMIIDEADPAAYSIRDSGYAPALSE